MKVNNNKMYKNKKKLTMNVHRNAVTTSSLNKQKCLANQAFMRVSGISKSLLITI